LVQRIQDGFLEFDRMIASADMMALAGCLGKVMGPRGLMPNPKVGAMTPNVAQAVKDARGAPSPLPHIGRWLSISCQVIVRSPVLSGSQV